MPTAVFCITYHDTHGVVWAAHDVANSLMSHCLHAIARNYSKATMGGDTEKVFSVAVHPFNQLCAFGMESGQIKVRLVHVMHPFGREARW